jgi:thiol-disulfide isomerase/thioredoxin
MKKIYALLLILLVSSCNSEKETQITSETFFKTGTISISGEIKNYTKNDDKSLFFEQKNILSGKTVVIPVKINEEGKFDKTLTIYNPHEIQISFMNQKLLLLVNHQDNLNLVIDTKKKKAITIKGIGSVRNNILQQYNTLSIAFKRDYYNKVSGKKVEVILNEYTKVEKSLDSIKKFILAQIKPEKILLNWLEADKVTLRNYDLIQYSIMNESTPETFLSHKNIISKNDINNISYFLNSSYNDDLFNNYLIGCIIKENRKIYIKVNDELKNENYKKGIELLSDSLFKNHKGLAKDIVLYRFFEQMMRPTFVDVIGKTLNEEKLKKEYLKNIENEFVKSVLLSETSNVTSSLSVDENSSDDIISDLLSKHKNKVLYVDISATWCGPCIEQLPYSVNLHESLKGKNIVFVYLFAKSKKKDWEKLSQKYNLKGENLFISEYQYKLLLSKYGIDKGFPEYFIVDRNKEIHKNANIPSSENIKKDLLHLL